MIDADCKSGRTPNGYQITTESRGCVISHIQYALKGQKLLAQGIALGYYRRKLVAL